MKIIYRQDEIEQVAQKFLEKIFAHVSNFGNLKNKATIICLTGDLGAGKTTLMQSIGKVLGVKDKIVSPTFVLRRDFFLKQNTPSNFSNLPHLRPEGELEQEQFEKLIHIDAYRLDKKEMINQILTKEEMENKKNLIIIEWGELLDKNIFDLTFEIKHVGESEREIELK